MRRRTLILILNFFMKTFLSIRKKRPGATFAGIFSVALSSVLLLCGAGLTPTGTVQRGDINANGFSLTNAATVSATNGYFNTIELNLNSPDSPGGVLALGSG